MALFRLSATNLEQSGKSHQLTDRPCNSHSWRAARRRIETQSVRCSNCLPFLTDASEVKILTVLGALGAYSNFRFCLAPYGRNPKECWRCRPKRPTPVGQICRQVVVRPCAAIMLGMSQEKARRSIWGLTFQPDTEIREKAPNPGRGQAAFSRSPKYFRFRYRFFVRGRAQAATTRRPKKLPAKGTSPALRFSDFLATSEGPWRLNFAPVHGASPTPKLRRSIVRRWSKQIATRGRDLTSAETQPRADFRRGAKNALVSRLTPVHRSSHC